MVTKIGERKRRELNRKKRKDDPANTEVMATPDKMARLLALAKSRFVIDETSEHEIRLSAELPNKKMLSLIRFIEMVRPMPPKKVGSRFVHYILEGVVEKKQTMIHLIEVSDSSGTYAGLTSRSEGDAMKFLKYLESLEKEKVVSPEGVELR